MRHEDVPTALPARLPSLVQSMSLIETLSEAAPVMLIYAAVVDEAAVPGYVTIRLGAKLSMPAGT